jgi:hypothetical protein
VKSDYNVDCIEIVPICLLILLGIGLGLFDFGSTKTCTNLPSAQHFSPAAGELRVPSSAIAIGLEALNIPILYLTELEPILPMLNPA